MTAIDTPEQGHERRVRPWIAAVLTFLSWGLGFYYARRTKAAYFWAIASVIVAVIGGGALIAYVLVFSQAKPAASYEDVMNGASIINLAATLLVAIVAWISTAKDKLVEKSGPSRLLGYLFIWLLPLVASLILAMTIRFSVAQPFRIPAGSMQPTLSIGDYVIVSKGSYGYSRFSFAPFEKLLPDGRWYSTRLPQRGDVVVFRPAQEADRDFVKRIVGLPGDRIQMDQERIWAQSCSQMETAPILKSTCGAKHCPAEYRIRQ